MIPPGASDQLVSAIIPNLTGKGVLGMGIKFINLRLSSSSDQGILLVDGYWGIVPSMMGPRNCLILQHMRCLGEKGAKPPYESYGSQSRSEFLV